MLSSSKYIPLGMSVKSGRHSGDVSLSAPWMKPLKAALNHGGTKRPKRDRREAKRKYVQLATVDPSTGRPCVRTVAFRGFLKPSQVQFCSDAPLEADDESCMLCFVTDSRSEKVSHLSKAPAGSAFVECCWWLDEAGVQFRISGHAILARATSEDAELRALCENVWCRLQDSTRSTFMWPTPGALRCKTSLEEHVSGAAATDLGDIAPILDDMEDGDETQRASAISSLLAANFAVVVVIPSHVDELHLGGKQKRFQYSREEAKEGNANGLLWTESSEWTVREVNP